MVWTHAHTHTRTHKHTQIIKRQAARIKINKASVCFSMHDSSVLIHKIELFQIKRPDMWFPQSTNFGSLGEVQDAHASWTQKHSGKHESPSSCPRYSRVFYDKLGALKSSTALCTVGQYLTQTWVPCKEVNYSFFSHCWIIFKTYDVKHM